VVRTALVGTVALVVMAGAAAASLEIEIEDDKTDDAAAGEDPDPRTTKSTQDSYIRSMDAAFQ
jgi:hypothetical protein